MALIAYADRFGDFEYQSSGSGITITSYLGPGGAVTIPAVIADLPVIRIGAWAFSWHTGLLSVAISDNVTHIGDGAFEGCSNLRAVTIPANVTHIGDWAFAGCSRLTDLTIDEGLIEIGDGAFSNCTSLTHVTIPESLTSLGNYAFSWCTGLTHVSIPGNVTSIGYRTFAGCSGLTDVTLPESITSIGDYAFQGCESLIRINIPAGVISLGWYAFAGCTNLRNVTIPDTVIDLGDYLFSGCVRLISARFEGDAPAYANHVFHNCPALIVYYRPRTAGWNSTFDGRPTALWLEPPSYSEWIQSTRLLDLHPDASSEEDDPDQDGMTNYAEMLAGTDPVDPTSLFAFEPTARPDDLSEEDSIPIGPHQKAWFVQTVPGKTYGLLWADDIEGTWHLKFLFTATTTQKRLVLNKPTRPAFYRVILAQ